MLARRLRANPIASHLGAILAYLLLSLIATYPLVNRFGAEALGEDYPDRVQMMWNLWWVKTALLDEHRNPFHTDLLFYPHGADLYFHWLNLPLALVALLPQVLFGIVVAYNCAMLFALVLAGYAGWRLVYYLTQHGAAALCAGVIIGFNSLGLISTRSQINLVNSGPLVLCIEFYLRAWERGRPRDGILAGLCFTLALLTVGYYEVYLLIFVVVHLGWMLLADRGQRLWVRVATLARRARPVLGWGGGTAVLLAGPYVLAALAGVLRGQLTPQSALDTFRGMLNSADLLSFVLPYRAHWLLGQAAPWWAAVDPAIHDHTYLGLVGVGLAAVGVLAARQRAETWLWVAVGAAGALLATGPVLQINGLRIVPMPFALVQNVPPFSLVRFPERFVFLTYIAVGVLAAGGVRRLLDSGVWIRSVPAGQASDLGMRSRPNQNPPSKIQHRAVAVILALLLLDLPLYPRSGAPLALPASLAAIRDSGASGAVIEWPFTQHDWVDSFRMGYQIGHGHPITSGYLSRTPPDPFDAACSPFRFFTLYPANPPRDIVSPAANAQIPALLHDYGAEFLAVYKIRPYNSQRMEPIPAPDLQAIQAFGTTLGVPLADDAVATVYRLRASTGLTAPVLQLGADWDDVEQSGGRPFRWLNGSAGDFCVFAPASTSAALAFRVASFATPRHLQVLVEDRLVFESVVPADGQLHAVVTAPLGWPAGPQLVRLRVPEGTSRPSQGREVRELSLGFAGITLEATP